MGVFGGARSPELQGLYRVKGLHGPQRDLAQAREPPQTEPVPRFGVEVPTDKSEELGDVSHHSVPASTAPLAVQESNSETLAGPL